MNPVQYIFANRGLGMSPGKLAAQVAHASVLSYVGTPDEELKKEWIDSGHYTKLVMLAEDTEHLFTIERYLNERSLTDTGDLFRRIKTFLVIDEGRSEIRPHSATALGVEIVDKDSPHVQQVFGDFKTYREEKAPKKQTIKERFRR